MRPMKSVLIYHAAVILSQCFNWLTNHQVYVFKNIRYAAPPVGVLRWAKPAPPTKRAGIQDGRDGSSCTQPVIQDVRTTQDAFVGPGREDCLFLDLTIPRKVFDEPWLKLPVLVWIHGGYYGNFLSFCRVMNRLMIPFSCGIER